MISNISEQFLRWRRNDACLRCKCVHTHLNKSLLREAASISAVRQLHLVSCTSWEIRCYTANSVQLARWEKYPVIKKQHYQAQRKLTFFTPSLVSENIGKLESWQRRCRLANAKHIEPRGQAVQARHVH